MRPEQAMKGMPCYAGFTYLRFTSTNAFVTQRAEFGVLPDVILVKLVGWLQYYYNGIQPEHMSTVVAGSNPAESNIFQEKRNLK